MHHYISKYRISFVVSNLVLIFVVDAYFIKWLIKHVFDARMTNCIYIKLESLSYALQRWLALKLRLG